ncbi:MAG: hypothetical protein V8S22_08345 [Lachnospiraceae bacterium]
MSGPKTSHYTLTLEQRRILEEQRKIRLEREILTKQLGDARSIIAETERLIEQMEPLFVEIGADTLTLSQVKMFYTRQRLHLFHRHHLRVIKAGLGNCTN